jgi:hypothetical protein
VLKTKKMATDKTELSEFVDLLSRFSGLTDLYRKLLLSKNTFEKGVAILVIARLGSKDKDLPVLQSFSKTKTRLPGIFKYKTISDAAAMAIDKLKKKG